MRSGDVALGISDSLMRRGEARRADAELRSRAVRSGDVALSITGSSMRRGKTSRRGAEHECVAERHQLFVDGAKRGDMSRRGADK